MGKAEITDICWVDLETTGLDPHEHDILEIGIVITDKDLAQKCGFQSLILPTRINWRSNMDEYVFKMHTENGLLEELARVEDSDQADFWSPKNVGDQIDAFWCQHVGEEIKLPMAGNSIGSFDRPWAKARVPDLHRHLTHRNIDASSFLEVIKRWYPDIELPEKTNTQHRVMGDLQNAIDMLKWVRETMFIADPQALPVYRIGDKVEVPGLCCGTVSFSQDGHVSVQLDEGLGEWVGEAVKLRKK